MSFKRLAVLAALLVCASLGAATSARAASFHSSGYPRFAYEGGYGGGPTCHYNLLQHRLVVWRGRTITLKYFYSGRCGSFAAINNAPRDCSVFLDRTPTRSTRFWSHVGETVDPGHNFAYTKIGNNLNGRNSRAALVCGAGMVLARTAWY